MRDQRAVAGVSRRGIDAPTRYRARGSASPIRGRDRERGGAAEAAGYLSLTEKVLSLRPRTTRDMAMCRALWPTLTSACARISAGTPGTRERPVLKWTERQSRKPPRPRSQCRCATPTRQGEHSHRARLRSNRYLTGFSCSEVQRSIASTLNRQSPLIRKAGIRPERTSR
jgi:hypothetical protein